MGIAVTTVDVDSDPELQRLYDFRVPVALVDGRVVGEGRIEPAQVAAEARAERRPPARVVITTAGPELAAEVHRLTRLAFGGYTWLTPPSGAITETEDDVRRDLRQHGGALARLDGSAVGALRLVRESSHLQVRRVAVDPAVQGRGLGRALMEWAHDHALALGYSEVRLGVRAQLPQNRSFYEGLGYGVLRAHSRPGTDEVAWYEMSRRLTG